MRENPLTTQARSLVDSIKSRKPPTTERRRRQGLDVLNQQDEVRQKKSTNVLSKLLSKQIGDARSYSI